jgi:hypothetical protein
MRDYGKVSPKFWIGQTGKALRKQGLEAQLVALYLLTSPHANMLGLYYVPKAFIAHEIGLGFEAASKGLQGCIEAGFCRYDDDSEMVWVMEMARFQIADQLKDKDLRIKGVQNEYDSLPENPYLGGFFAMYAKAFCMFSNRAQGSLFEAPSKPLASQEQEQEQEKGKPKPSSSAGADCDDAGEAEPEKAKPFDQFWAAYPRRVGKQDALKAWTKIKPDAMLLAMILHAIEKQKEGADWRKDDGQFIPHPATWLRAGRWLDEVRPYAAPPPKLPGGWWETPESIKAAGLMLDPPLEPRPGEGQKAFALRIRVALGEVDMPTDQVRGYTLSLPPEKIERPYMPPTVPEGVQLTDEQRQARRDELREAMRTMSEKAGNARAGIAASNERQAA